jgi:hypothetical protein
MGGFAAEVPGSPDEQPAAGLRASDADRDQVVARLREEYVAGRLSHDTFLHRVDLVLESRRQAELPPMVADLPAPPAARSLGGWLAGTWQRVAEAPRRAGWLRGGADREDGPQAAVPRPGGPRPGVPSTAGPRRALTTSMGNAPGGRRPLALPFPRGTGSRFSIGRDASCDLAIADMTVSRRHAELERTPDGWLLADLKSTNGTRVNGWRVRGKVPVQPGDLVNFGDQQVFFLPGDAPLARP